MKKAVFLFLFIFSCLFSVAGVAQQSPALDYGIFARLPVLDAGRFKPLDSFARNRLRQFSSREKLEGMNAPAWIAEVFFDPARAAQRPLFLVSSPELRQQWGLPAGEKQISFETLQKALQKSAAQIDALQAEQASLTQSQKELLRLHENALEYAGLLRSFSFILPLDIDVPSHYRPLIKESDNTYMALARIEARVLADVRKLVRNKGGDPGRYTPEEQQMAALAFRLDLFRRAGQDNKGPRLIPDVENGQDTWVAPWRLVIQGQATSGAPSIQIWKHMADAYRAGNPKLWRDASRAAETYLENHLRHKTSPARLKLEIFYNALKPFGWACAFYFTAFLCALLSVRWPYSFRRAGSAALVAGVFLHTAGMAARIILLQRPPVGTLYESILFVSLICAASTMLLAWKNRRAGLFAAGALTSACLLTLAPFLAPADENMEMLVAVLNTNFWLATHVLCVTAGYAVSILSAGLAHFYLMLRIAGSNNDTRNLQQILHRVSLAALLLMTLGTALGGIWADQSWGRFWGWDPKENGALLIVLWLVWTQHGRLSGHLKPLAFAAALAFLNVVVALSWFGVNLLSVGLHSYGFTSGMAAGLGAFCAVEILLIAGLVIAAARKENHVLLA